MFYVLTVHPTLGSSVQQNQFLLPKLVPLFEYLLKHRPISVQSNGKTKWKERVFELFSKERKGKRLLSIPIRFSLIHLCHDDCTTDIDNIVKPIQDALKGSVIEDDFQVIDIDAHRRMLSEPIETTRLPSLLQKAITTGRECVYVQVSLPKELNFFL